MLFSERLRSFASVVLAVGLCLRQGVMGAVPGVVLTQGGSAMAVAFNSIAILFICDIDNLSYQYGLSEHLKERVDTYGHVLLHDNQVRKKERKQMGLFLSTVFNMKCTVLPRRTH